MSGAPNFHAARHFASLRSGPRENRLPHSPLRGVNRGPAAPASRL